MSPKTASTQNVLLFSSPPSGFSPFLCLFVPLALGASNMCFHDGVVVNLGDRNSQAAISA
jgi:hypothetical protein